MKRFFRLYGLIAGFTAVLCLVLILIFNQSFTVGLIRFIPEGNPYIKFPELVFGCISLIPLTKMIIEEVKKQEDKKL